MALTPTDEFLHRPPEPLPDRWQENYFLLGWDDDRRCGFYLHIERFIARRVIEIKAVLISGDDTASLSAEHPLTPVLEAPGLSVDIAEPFRTWNLHFDGRGQAGPGPGGFVAHTESGDTPMSLDVVIRSTLPPIDWNEALRDLAIPGIEHNHYELAATWEGTLEIGTHRVKASGLLVRDHTWGVRDYTTFPLAWWTPVCFEGAEAFFTGCSLLHRGRWVGVSIASADGQTTTVPGHVVELGEGRLDVRGYQTSTITAGGADTQPIVLQAETRVHVPVRYPGFAPDYFLNDAFSVVRWGDRKGFGTIELNSSVPPAELDALVAAGNREPAP